MAIVNEKSDKMLDKSEHNTINLYNIAAKILKDVKIGKNYKTLLYKSQYPNKPKLHAVMMNVFKWEPVIHILIQKCNILIKDPDIDIDLIYILITEMIWSKFGLDGNDKNILTIKSYKDELTTILADNKFEKDSIINPIKDEKPRFFRVNTLIISVEDMMKRLTKLKFTKLKTPLTYVKFLKLIKSNEFKLTDYVQDIHIKEIFVFHPKMKFYKIKEYRNGSLILQDKASCLASYLLNPEPESTVLDMCAAPGMKTSHLASIMQNKGKIYAVDNNKERFNMMKELLYNYQVKNVEMYCMDAFKFTHFDDVKYILIDPSCSGSGMYNRIRNNKGESEENVQRRLKRLANIHAKLINHAFKNYPKVERLVFSTCSENPEENEAVVDEVLSVNGKFELLDCNKAIKGWSNNRNPGFDCSYKCINATEVDCTNGFFIAVFVRRNYKEKIDVNVDKESNSVSNKKSKKARRKERKFRQSIGDEQLDSKQSLEKIKQPKDLKDLEQSDTKQSHKKIKKPKDLKDLEQSDTKQSRKKIKKPKDLKDLEQSDTKQSHKKIKKPKDLKDLEQSDTKQSRKKIKKPKDLKDLEQSDTKQSLEKAKKSEGLEQSGKKRLLQDSEQSPEKIKKSKQF